MDNGIFKQEYFDLIHDTDNHLSNNKEWVARFRKYINDMTSNESLVNGIDSWLRKIEDPLFGYSCINDITNFKNGSATIDMRFAGQSVFKVKIKKANASNIWNIDKVLIDKKQHERNQRYYEDYPCALTSTLKESQDHNFVFDNLCSYYNAFPNRITGKNRVNNNEHKLESQVLTSIARISSADKPYKGIQPIRFLNLRFQMPTPFKASDAKKGKLQYAFSNGGGIDILARVGRGIHSRLTIIELKDNYENPDKAIKQAIIYATFIRRLLRTDAADNLLWWKFFGYKNNSIPSQLSINVIIAMPSNPKGDSKNIEMMVKYEEDQFNLHSMYFNNIDFSKPVFHNLIIDSTLKSGFSNLH